MVDNSNLIKLIDLYENTEWANVEESLGKIKFDDLISVSDQNPDIYRMKCYVDKDGNDIDVPIEKPKEVDALIESYIKVKEEFRNWAKEIEVNSSSYRQSIADDLQGNNFYVLSFNYTHTIEELYNVSRNDILHIHGSQEDEVDKIQFGHGIDIPELTGINTLKVVCSYLSYQMDDEGALYLPDVHIKKALKKDTKRIVSEHRQDFEKYRDVQDIYFFGFSFETVDRPYLEKLIEVCPNANWHIYEYNHEEDCISEDLKQKLTGLNIKKYCLWLDWEKTRSKFENKCENCRLYM